MHLRSAVIDCCTCAISCFLEYSYKNNYLEKNREIFGVGKIIKNVHLERDMELRVANILLPEQFEA